MSDPLLPIGELATRTGLSVTTVRYYDEIGLIAAAARVGGKRRFELEAVGRVSFIRRAQDAGFALDEIREILDDTSGEWRLLLDEKLAELTERRRRLDTMIDMLDSFRTCGCEIVATCPRMSEAEASPATERVDGSADGPRRRGLESRGRPDSIERDRHLECPDRDRVVGDVEGG